nr:restriction endonuclease [Acidobacteriota bacterium]
YPRYVVQAPDGKSGEIDLRVDGTDGRTLMIEVKKHKDPIDSDVVTRLAERAALFAVENPDRTVQPCILATGGFRPETLDACKNKIGTAAAIDYVHKSWSTPD